MTMKHRVLVVGAGGLGSPLLRLLAQRGVEHLTVIDDDVVEESNLHRQTLFNEADVGRRKIECVEERLHAIAPKMNIQLLETRFVPSNAQELLAEHTLVAEGADNLPTKFLVADAARLAGLPAVQGGAVRWNGWAWCGLPGSACLRCLFEDIPRDRVETCAEAGVVGPVVGVLGALQAALIYRLLEGDHPAGELWHYRGLEGSLRQTWVRQRSDCPLCTGQINDLRMERYTAACAA